MAGASPRCHHSNVGTRQATSSLLAVVALCGPFAAGCAGDTPAKVPKQDSAPDLPNIALHEDGETPITCDEWPDLSDDVQHGLVSSALGDAGVVPATEAKVDIAREIVDAECEGEPHSVAYVVAMRAGMSL